MSKMTRGLKPYIEQVRAARAVTLAPGGFGGIANDVHNHVRQSAAIHPDWDVDTHLGYLIAEIGYAPGILRAVTTPVSIYRAIREGATERRRLDGVASA